MSKSGGGLKLSTFFSFEFVLNFLRSSWIHQTALAFGYLLKTMAVKPCVKLHRCTRRNKNNDRGVSEKWSYLV